jgi:3'(2'), 5'-bisphosphate nucleotidase
LPSFDPAAGDELLEALTAISISAADAIRSAQRDDTVRIKSDGSPVTAADEAAEAAICASLERLNLGWPVISEERADQIKPPLSGETFILVDPLDGTREVIAGRNEYTVNIGLVVEGKPVIGIITAPALGLIWRGIVGYGADRLEFSSRKTSPPQAIHTRVRPQGELLVVVSRTHLDADTQAYLDGLPHTSRVQCGSSIKFCRIAEGAADHYPRLGPTHDWDIAAGHALLTAAGGNVIDPDGAALSYGTSDLHIPAFLAWGGPVPTEGALKSAY